MKTRMLVSILILVLAVLIIIGGCAPTSKVFFKLVRSGDYAEVKRLIDKGADVNAQDNEGSTALKWARTKKHPKIVELLKEAGAKE